MFIYLLKEYIFTNGINIGVQSKVFNYLAIHAKPARAVAEIDGLVDVYNSIPSCFGRVRNF